MRVLFQTAAALALTCISATACMSSNVRTDSSPKAGTPKDYRNQNSPDVESAEAPPEGSAALPPKSESIEEEKSACEKLKREFKSSVFIPEAQALIIGLDQTCKKPTHGDEYLQAKFSAIGVSCTGGPGLVSRKGHSNQNWEVINFKLDLSCPMKSADDLRTYGKKKYAFAAEPTVSAFIPMMIEYWEFEQNNDAGTGTLPTLTAAGGGAQQWNKGVQKNISFPIKLYGHSSSWGKDLRIFEAKATIHPRSNQRQFDVTVQDMKELSQEEIQATLERCLSKTSPKSACRDAFSDQ